MKTSFEELVMKKKAEMSKARNNGKDFTPGPYTQVAPAKQNDVVPVEKPLTKKERIAKLGLKLIQGGKAYYE